MKLILVIFCVLAVYEAHGFICNSKEIARAFGALEHCSQHVWIKPINLEKNTQDKFGCQICRDMNTVYKQLQNPQVQTAIKTYSADVCKLLAQSMQKVCLNFVDQQLIAKLTTYLNPASCNSLLACQNTTESYHSNAIEESARTFPKLFQAVNSQLGPCSLCEVIVDEIRMQLESMTEEKFKEMLKHYACYYAGSLKSQCSMYIDLISDVVYEEVTDFFKNDNICANFGCSSKVDNLEKISESMFFDKNREESQCDTCQKIIETVEQEVKNLAPKEEIKKTLLQLCPLYPPEQISDCEKEMKNMDDEDLEEFLSAIELIDDPKVTCIYQGCEHQGVKFSDLVEILKAK